MIDGPNRAGARSMMRAVGYGDEDFKRPLVGVAHSWIEIMPCNINQRELAGWVKEGIREAGGTPVEIWESREYWSEVNAMLYLKERISKENFYCFVFNKIKRNIEEYAKGYEQRFDQYSEFSSSPCWN